ncbi:MAG: helix-turn-helix domain-containing protein [Pseudomonadales bacterium]|jgi:DNA-binding IclR family transcriptional regulator|nr:helix-turn-helix domain-containing protein [Pseudomonadales bacterium]
MNPRQNAPHLPAARGSQSIDRAISLLQLIAAHHAQGIALRELVEATGLDRTTVYRIASSLVRAGLVSRDADSGVYALGIEAMALGFTSMQRAPLLASCVPAMKALARRSGEHVFLIVRSGDYSQCLHMEEGRLPIRGFAETVGNMRLLGLGIPSFALLARMSDQDVAAHFARHKEEYHAERMSAMKLQYWIRQARQQGYAQVSAKGIGGVGLRFALGSCGDAALGIVAPASRVTRARGPALAALLREEMRRLE